MKVLHFSGWSQYNFALTFDDFYFIRVDLSVVVLGFSRLLESMAFFTERSGSLGQRRLICYE